MAYIYSGYFKAINYKPCTDYFTIRLGLRDLTGLKASGAGKYGLDLSFYNSAHFLQIGQDYAVVHPGDLASGSALGLVLALAGHRPACQTDFTAIKTYYSHFYSPLF